jgi:hypothetical protein
MATKKSLKKAHKPTPKASVSSHPRRKAAGRAPAATRVESSEPTIIPTLSRDPRLPAPGTVLSKRDRNGHVRCECTIERDGVTYDSTKHRSLTAAAMAAAHDLGIKGAQNGYVFWGLAKPARASADVLGRLETYFTRYEASARSALATPPKGEATAVRDVLERHRERAAALG